jgi:hypothetical protein
MSECFICYDFDRNNSDIIYLECMHFLCNSCLKKLKNNTCPFCRSNICSEIMNYNHVKKLTQTVNTFPTRTIRVRTRNKRRHTITETINGTNIIIETPKYIKQKRPKLDNKRKSKYHRFRATIFGH